MGSASDEQLWRRLKQRFRAWTGMKLYDSVRVTALDSLRQLARASSHRSAVDFLTAADDAPDERQALLDQIGMGTTWFLRDRGGIDALVAAFGRTMRKSASLWIWCAGCSSGEEPYSLAMALDAAGFSARILATDLNRTLLQRARAAEYPRHAIADLSPSWKVSYTEPVGADYVRIADTIRRRVDFQLHNFLTDPSPPHGWGAFDAVICRNVLIYFERAMAARAIERFSHACRPDGYLLLGAVERPFLWMGEASNSPEVTPATELMRMRSEWQRAFARDAPRVSAHNGRGATRAAGTRKPPILARLGTPSPAVKQRKRARTVQDELVELEEMAMSDTRLDRVLERIDGVLAEEPLSASAHLARGLAQWRGEQLEAAANAFRMARCIDGSSWMAPYLLGRCLEELEELRDAREAYLHALSVIEAGGASGLASGQERVEAMAQTAAEKCRAFLDWCRRLYGDG